MMYPVQMPESDHSYANWYIKFATNTLGLAYTSGSKYAAEINADNWYEILARPDVKLGLPDPRFDACGYRAMMACWLAGLLYDDSDLFHKVLGDFEYPILLQWKMTGAPFWCLRSSGPKKSAFGAQALFSWEYWSQATSTMLLSTRASLSSGTSTFPGVSPRNQPWFR
jgi:ABC-type molybdate transport system substrate-binding protein